MNWKKLIIVIIAALLVIQTVRVVRSSGLLIQIEPVQYGQCQKMMGPSGAEDITIDVRNKMAFVSAGNGRAVVDHYRFGKPGVVENGDIWLLDLGNAESEPIRLNVDVGWSFHPHGIDLLHLDNGDRELYVINHPTPIEHEVLIFRVTPSHQLELKRQVHYDALISPNDIRAISSDVFLATNDHGYPRSSPLSTVEEYLAMPWSSVSYFDGKKGTITIEGLTSANGITLAQDQNTLYVAEAIGRSIKRYEKGSGQDDWKLVETLDVDTAVDNLEWGDDGYLYAGAHPKLFDFLGHAKDASQPSPSHAIKVDVQSSPMTFETIYMDDGTEISGSSVAAVLDEELLIGSVFEPYFLRCNKD